MLTRKFPFPIKQVINRINELHSLGTNPCTVAEELSNEFGFENIARRGGNKFVYLHDDVVIKYVCAEHVWVMKDERYVRTKLRQAGKASFLPKTAFIKDRFIVQERCDVDYTKYERHQCEIERVAQELGVRDVFSGNVGWKGNKYLFIDAMSEKAFLGESSI